MKRLGTINLDTGEILVGVPVWVGTKPKIGDRWFMAFQDSLIALAGDEELTKEPLKVLIYLLGRLDFENFLQVPQSEIAKVVKMHRTQVSRAVKLLTTKQIIIPGPKVGRASSFRLNPHYGWKGKICNLHEAKANSLKVIKGKKNKESQALGGSE